MLFHSPVSLFSVHDSVTYWLTRFSFSISVFITALHLAILFYRQFALIALFTLPFRPYYHINTAFFYLNIVYLFGKPYSQFSVLVIPGSLHPPLPASDFLTYHFTLS